MIPPDSDHQWLNQNGSVMVGMGDPFLSSRSPVLTLSSDRTGIVTSSVSPGEGDSTPFGGYSSMMDGALFEGMQPISIAPSTLMGKADEGTSMEDNNMTVFGNSVANNKAREGCRRGGRKRRSSAPEKPTITFETISAGLNESESCSESGGTDSPIQMSSVTSSSISRTIDIPRRDAHMASEQRRRAIMSQCFDQLRNLLPVSEYRKPSKANLLQATVHYIEAMQRSYRSLQVKTQFLLQENSLLNQKVTGGTFEVPAQSALSYTFDPKIPIPALHPSKCLIAPAAPPKKAEDS